MRALNLLRNGPNYRRDSFTAGLTRAGCRVVEQLPDPKPGDVLLIWNRSGVNEHDARRFESVGATVLVAENGYLGKEWLGIKWFALAIGHHNGLGLWHDEGPDRWDRYGVELHPWRSGHEVVVLPQRGIGEPGIAMPRSWPAAKYGRVREHPGIRPCKPLNDDLAHAAYVVTWGSGAALKALLFGVPVYYGLSGWIGAQAALPISDIGGSPKRSDADRLAMFRRLAWAQWTVNEIETGEPFLRLM